MTRVYLHIRAMRPELKPAQCWLLASRVLGA